MAKVMLALAIVAAVGAGLVVTSARAASDQMKSAVQVRLAAIDASIQ